MAPQDAHRSGYIDVLENQSGVYEIDRLKKERVEIQAKANGKVKSVIDKLLEQNGLTLGDLYPRAAMKRSRAKYINPKNSEQTWAGRGRKPTWFIEAVAQGRTLDELRVQ